MSIFSRTLTSPDPVHSDAVIGPVWVELDLPDDAHDDEDDEVLMIYLMYFSSLALSSCRLIAPEPPLVYCCSASEVSKFII